MRQPVDSMSGWQSMKTEERGTVHEALKRSRRVYPQELQLLDDAAHALVGGGLTSGRTEGRTTTGSPSVGIR